MWEGLTRAEIDDRFTAAMSRWAVGESDEAMAERVLAALGEIAKRHAGGRVVVVTSAGPIRAAEAKLRGIDQGAARREIPPVPNCTPVEVVLREGTWL